MSEKKFASLLKTLKKMPSVVIAYSGGVDSTLLLKAIKLAGIGSLAVTAVSETMPKDDLIAAKKMAGEIGIKHKIIKTNELKEKKFATNPPERCFYCKDELFKRLKEIADRGNYEYVLDGSNVDDMKDWRPGAKAALKYRVRSPLRDAGLNKKEIRNVSRKLKLPTWDRPASPCLASRFPYGETITKEALKRVSEAEKFLKSLGFREFRVRHHKDIARIEHKEEDIKKMFDPGIRKAITDKFKSLGYKFVTLDLEGFRSGRFNEGLNKKNSGKRKLS